VGAEGCQFFGNFTANLGTGDDVFGAEFNEFHEKTKVNGQAGDDFISLCLDNDYFDDVRVNGGSNFDTLELPFDLRPGILNKSKQFEDFIDCGDDEIPE
jgi:hypothetical protein